MAMDAGSVTVDNDTGKVYVRSPHSMTELARAVDLVVRPQQRAVSIGDSTAAGVATATPSAIVGAGRIATATNSGHSIMTGSRILVSRCDQPEFNGLTEVIASDSTTYTFRLPNGANYTGDASSSLGFQVRMLDAWNGTNVLAIASAMGGWLFDDIVNLSVGSETAAETLARFGTALAQGASLIEIRTGINSVNADESADSIFETIRQMGELTFAAGARLLLHTVGPLGSSHASYSTTRLAVINRLNRLIKGYCVRNATRAKCLDTFALWVDPMSTAGDWRSGYTTDYIHPLSKASWYAAKAVLPWLQRHYSPLPWPVASVTDDIVDDASSLNLFEYGLCTGSSGTITAATGNSGTISDGLSATVQGTPVTTVNTHGQTRADGIGYDNRCVITADSSGDGISFLATSATLHQRFDDYPRRLTRSGVNFRVTATDVDFANVQFSWNITENSVARSINAMNGLVIPAGETADLWFATPAVPIPPGTLSSVRPRLTTTLSGAGEATVFHGAYFSQLEA